jgi:serine/threonine protein kinase
MNEDAGRHKNVSSISPLHGGERRADRYAGTSFGAAAPRTAAMTQAFSFSETSAVPESRSKPISARPLRFLCRLGQGGMAEIHLASSPPPGPELVVVKRMHQQHAEEPTTVRMFLDEARLALCLVHPNIVRSERLGIFEGRHGIVMEFLEGQPLHLVLQRVQSTEVSLRLDTIVQIAIAALDGLHYAHELKDVVGNHLGLVHRDVSPQNLFITYDGAVKLLDFGIAKNSMQEGRTRTGLLKGKLSYMAPEQARGTELDRRADIWSVGIVLWEAMTGSRLFKADNEAATLQLLVASAPVALPSTRRADVPRDLEAILMRALEREPEKRYPTAAAMRDDLELWLSSREPEAGQSLPQLMKRLFGREIREQRLQIQGLLQSQPELADNGGTLIAPLLGGSTQSGSLRGTQVSSVTDLMEELTRQRRVTTRLLSGMLALVACSLAFGVYWTLVLRPEQAQNVAASLNAASPARVIAALPTAPSPFAEPVRRPAPEAPRAASVPPQQPVADPGKARTASLKPAAPPPPAAVTGPAPTTSTRETTTAQPAQAVVAPETGRLNLDTQPWSVVSVNGRVLGQTPIVGASLPVGTHTLLLVNPEQGLKTTYQVTITAGHTTARRIGLD